MTVVRTVLISILVLPVVLAAQGSAPRPALSDSTTVGPQRGTVMVVGGGALGPEILSRFIAASGGPDALIIDVPNAGAADACTHAHAAGARLFRNAGAKNVQVLCTTDRAVANSDSFIAPLRHAGGVWFEGGRQYRLVDAYAGTRTEQAFHDVLKRDGAVGGSSAGASILGDFLVRGAPSSDNRILDYPGYEKGFAFLRGVAIDQHVVARERLPDLADSIMSRHPTLLGMSEDEGTAWVVRGDTAVIVGRNKAFAYSGRVNDPGKPFLTLHPGDRYNLATRSITHRAIEDSPLTAAFVDSLFAKYSDSLTSEATVLVAQNGEVFVDRSYGVPDQPRYMPTTTLPQFPLGQISGVFTALCAQLPVPSTQTESNANGIPPRTTTPNTAFQNCMTRQVYGPIGMHRTTVTASGEVHSDVDELYRFELGLENPRTWPGVDVARGWTPETHNGHRWLAAYAMDGGKRAAFVRIPDRDATVIVLTNDDTADAKRIADVIAHRLLATSLIPASTAADVHGFLAGTP